MASELSVPLVVPVSSALRERGIAIIRDFASTREEIEQTVEVYRALVAFAGEAHANPVKALRVSIGLRADVAKEQVSKHTRELERLGLISVTRRQTEAHYLPNAWTLLTPNRRHAKSVSGARSRRTPDEMQLDLFALVPA